MYARAAIVTMFALGQLLPAQAPVPQHLLRLSFQKGATQYYRMTETSRNPVGAQIMTSITELTLETGVTRAADGEVELRQTQRHLTVKTTDSPSKEPRLIFDSDQRGGKGGTLRRMIDKPVTMKLDDRGRISAFDVPELAGMAFHLKFFVHFTPLPESPVGIGRTWDATAMMPILDAGEREVPVACKLVAVTKGKATIETEAKGDSDQLRLPGGWKVEVLRVTTVIDLASGKLVESSSEMTWSRLEAGNRVEASSTEKVEAIDTPPAKEGSPAATKPAGGKD